jgi:hypothetical protein
MHIYILGRSEMIPITTHSYTHGPSFKYVSISTQNLLVSYSDCLTLQVTIFR